MCVQKRKVLLYLVFILLIAKASNFAQQQSPADWKAFNFLIGEWVGEGSGTPGEATGSSTFSFNLQDRVLIRNSYADYPAANNRPAFRHDDLMIIYQENKSIRAIYFDNEGHVINYTVSLSTDLNSIICLSEINPTAPRFRFTYTKMENNRMKFNFDFAPPGKPEEFSKYLDGMVRKKI